MPGRARQAAEGARRARRRLRRPRQPPAGVDGRARDHPPGAQRRLPSCASSTAPSQERSRTSTRAGQRDGPPPSTPGRRDPPSELLADLAAAIDRLEEAWGRATPDVWRHGVGRTSRTGVQPVADLPFRRWREVEVHRGPGPRLRARRLVGRLRRPRAPPRPGRPPGATVHRRSPPAAGVGDRPGRTAGPAALVTIDAAHDGAVNRPSISEATTAAGPPPVRIAADDRPHDLPAPAPALPPRRSPSPAAPPGHRPARRRAGRRRRRAARPAPRRLSAT